MPKHNAIPPEALTWLAAWSRVRALTIHGGAALTRRLVDDGHTVFAMAATCVRADDDARRGNAGAIELADVFCREAERRVEALFANFYGKNDGAMLSLSRKVLAGDYAWLEAGGISAWE